ncbi:MAG: UbiX family flavin prenyltransferase [Syntrophomonadaceae bacterium]|nr:UbiX family flavin prenyltransferase [Syntrophomonadaceae bacterium]
MPKYIVAITGASGIIYGVRITEVLLAQGYEVHLVVSEPGCIVMKQEMGWELGEYPQESLRQYFPQPGLYLYNNADIAARLASGSFITEGMVIVPCTMSTVAAVANGLSNNLIERTADVMLKERRPLIIVPRETPLSVIHLRNLLRLAEMGVAIVPAMPGFYHHPRNIDEMVSFMVGKILDIMRIPNDSFQRYE